MLLHIVRSFVMSLCFLLSSYVNVCVCVCVCVCLCSDSRDTLSYMHLI